MADRIKFESIDLSDAFIKKAYLEKDAQTFLSYLIAGGRSYKDKKTGRQIMEVDRTARAGLTALRKAIGELSVGVITQDQKAVMNVANAGKLFSSTVTGSLGAAAKIKGGINKTIADTMTSIGIEKVPDPEEERARKKQEEEVAEEEDPQAAQIKELKEQNKARAKKAVQLGSMKKILKMHLNALNKMVAVQNGPVSQSAIDSLKAKIKKTIDNFEEDELRLRSGMSELSAEHVANLESLSQEFKAISNQTQVVAYLYNAFHKTAGPSIIEGTAQLLLKTASITEIPVPEVRPLVGLKEIKHDIGTYIDRALGQSDIIKETRILARQAVKKMIESIKSFIRVVETNSGAKANLEDEKKRWANILIAFDSFADVYNNGIEHCNKLLDLIASESAQRNTTKRELKNQKETRLSNNDLLEISTSAMRGLTYFRPTPIEHLDINKWML